MLFETVSDYGICLESQQDAAELALVVFCWCHSYRFVFCCLPLFHFSLIPLLRFYYVALRLLFESSACSESAFAYLSHWTYTGTPYVKIGANRWIPLSATRNATEFLLCETDPSCSQQPTPRMAYTSSSVTLSMSFDQAYNSVRPYNITLAAGSQVPILSLVMPHTGQVMARVCRVPLIWKMLTIPFSSLQLSSHEASTPPSGAESMCVADSFM